MNETETGGPAFPERRNDVSGMTLRDYFAVKALPLVWDDNCAATPLWQRAESNDWMHGVANDAYSMAEAMLKARQI
jgi:hypothetical protein